MVDVRRMMMMGRVIPASAPARIRPSWTPALVGDSGNFTIGHEWSATVPVLFMGAWVYRPSALAATAATGRLYTAAGVLLASGTGTDLNTIGWNLIPFNYSASAGTAYVTAVEVTAEYGWDNNQLDNPITDPTYGVVTIPAGGGRFEFGHAFPSGSGTFMHGSDTQFRP